MRQRPAKRNQHGPRSGNRFLAGNLSERPLATEPWGGYRRGTDEQVDESIEPEKHHVEYQEKEQLHGDLGIQKGMVHVLSQSSHSGLGRLRSLGIADSTVPALKLSRVPKKQAHDPGQQNNTQSQPVGSGK